MFVFESIVLEFDQHVAFEDAVVEHQVNEEMFAADEQALLPRLEAEAVAEFEQEALQLVEQGVFEMAFAHHFLRLEADEPENIRIADHLPVVLRLGLGMGEASQRVLVGGEAAALKILGGDLALEFAHRPVAAQGFGFVEAALERVIQLQQFGEMGEGEAIQQ